MKKNYFFYVLFFLGMQAVLSQTALVNQTKHIRWGTTKNPLEGLTITWRGTGSTDQIKWGYTTSFEQGAHPGTPRDGYEDTFFNFTFPTVTANATIYYELFDSAGNAWTMLKTFRTAPPINTDDFSFIATGDSRGGAAVWNAISDLANAQQTDFTVFNGDIVSDASVPEQWNDWFDAGADFLSKNLVLHAQGNHDALSTPTYLNNFELPKSVPVTGTELYYAVQYGNAVFISLNSETPESTAQYNWLVSTLQANANKRWKIIAFHKPFYTMGPHAGEMDDYFNTWWAAFDTYGVDLILTGHDHMYERVKPINRSVSTTAPVPAYGSGPGNGRCQIVCGGAGAGLTDLDDAWFLESYKKSHNFIRFDVTKDEMCAHVYDEDNVQIDSFCITKAPLSAKGAATSYYPIRVVPNPAVDVFTIRYNSPFTGTADIKIFDTNGKLTDSLHAEKTTNDFSFSYDARKLQAGIYVVEIQVADQKDHVMMAVK